MRKLINERQTQADNKEFSLTLTGVARDHHIHSTRALLNFKNMPQRVNIRKPGTLRYLNSHVYDDHRLINKSIHHFFLQAYRKTPYIESGNELGQCLPTGKTFKNEIVKERSIIQNHFYQS